MSTTTEMTTQVAQTYRSLADSPLFIKYPSSEVYLTGNYIYQAPDQVPYNDGDDESEQKDEYGLDKVSSGGEINPADVIDLPGDEDEDEDSGLVPKLFPALTVSPCREEAEVGKPAMRPRVSDAAEQDTSTSQKLPEVKKLKDAAAPAPTGTDGNAPKRDNKKTGKESMPELPAGLEIQDTKLGEGPQATKGARVTMRYIGKLPDGSVFESNTKNKPAKDLCDRLL